jgi:hypothetical protein
LAAEEIRMTDEHDSFRHPERTSEDLAHLHAMLVRLRELIDRGELTRAAGEIPRVWFLEESGARRHRVVVNLAEALLTAQTMTIIGFFGHKHTIPVPSELDEMDKVLLADFPNHRHLASYNTLELDAGQHGNMVLFTHPDGIDQWRMTPPHLIATRDLSPKAYDTVRIHMGTLDAGWHEAPHVRIQRTKYYDYRQSTVPATSQRAYESPPIVAGTRADV